MPLPVGCNIPLEAMVEEFPQLLGLMVEEIPRPLLNHYAVACQLQHSTRTISAKVPLILG